MANPASEHNPEHTIGGMDSELGTRNSELNSALGPRPSALDPAETCVRLDPGAVLRATPRSFALRVRGQSMVGADICDGDTVVGEFTPHARSGQVVVALIDGEVALKRLIIRYGQPQLISENPTRADPAPLSELVIQGVVHTVVRRIV